MTLHTRKRATKRSNAALALLLLVLAAGLHFFKLDEPRSVVFDEVHFGRFMNAYCCSGAYFFDIHPPHAKLLVAGVAALGGYEGGQSFAAIHTPIDRVSPFLLRFVPALAGTLLPVVVAILLLQLGASRAAAFLGGSAVLLDNALLVQTRIVALDGVLLLATFGAMSAILAALSSQHAIARRAFALLAGMLSGLAVGTKFTGLVAIALVGLCVLVGLLWPGAVKGRLASASFARRLRRSASHAVWVLSGAAVVYLGGWMLHFALLSEPGPGDVWGAPTGAWLQDTLSVHQKMLASNFGLAETHPYASAWWSWPLMARPVFYWSGAEGVVYFLGNPVLWWGAVMVLVVLLADALWLFFVRKTKDAKQNSESERDDKSLARNSLLWIPCAGYALSLLPLIAVPRVLFLYHYLTPLLFAVCAVALGLDRIGWTRPGSIAQQRSSYHLAGGLLTLGFLAASPFTFSFVSVPAYQDLVFGLLPGWR